MELRTLSAYLLCVGLFLPGCAAGPGLQDLKGDQFSKRNAVEGKPWTCDLYLKSNYQDTEKPSEGIHIQFSNQDLEKSQVSMIEVWSDVPPAHIGRRKSVKWPRAKISEVKDDKPIVTYDGQQVTLHMQLPFINNPDEKSLVSFVAPIDRSVDEIVGQLSRGEHQSLFSMEADKECLKRVATQMKSIKE